MKLPNARTLAAIRANPACNARRVLDAAGVDKAALAERLGRPVPEGQSKFALQRGNRFERLRLHLAFIANDADDGAMLAGRNVRLQAKLLDALDDMIDLGRSGVRFEDNDHGVQSE